MSAIFGIVNKNGGPLDPSSLAKIEATLTHRNVDGAAFWQQGKAGLGHLKLCVYPEQRAEILPYETDGFVITADAKLHNRTELYHLLELKASVYETLPDANLIAEAYNKWGEKCAEKLNGEFVIAIWDKIAQQLVIITDHIGFRPVFYYNGPDVFIFCSEIKGILALKNTPNYFNEGELLEYHFRDQDAQRTYNKEVFALAGGNILKLWCNKLGLEMYWEPLSPGKYNFKRDEEWVDCFRELICNAVDKRINADVPIGITLSGGLDSTAIACILADRLKEKNKPLYAFSSVLPHDHQGIERDERHYIDLVGRHCPNIIQTYVTVPEISPFDDLPATFANHEMFPNPFHFTDTAIDKAALKRNIRILFNGYGGDFLASWKGNPVIYLLIRNGEYRKAWALLRSLKTSQKSSILQQLRVEYAIYTKFYKSIRKLLKPHELDWQQYSLLQEEFSKKHLDKAPKERALLNASESLRQLLIWGWMSRTTGLFTNRTAAFGMQSVIPLLDKDLLEFLADVPLHLFVKNGIKRSLFRNAMQGIIPNEVQWRTDKLPYSPGYHRRVLNDKKRLYQLMESKEYDFIFSKYFSKEKVRKHWDDVKPLSGFTPAGDIIGIRMMQTFISSIVMQGLKESGYIFEP